jgi:hypothetical protein
LLCCFPLAAILAAQTSPEVRQILDRLDRLEQQNKALAEEVHQLRQELAASRAPAQQPAPPLEERVAVQEARTQDLAQSKVGAAQHFPIRVTGMALFNVFRNSKGSAGEQYPLYAWPGRTASGGGSLRQTTIGLDYSGPQTFLGGRVHGSVYMDFWGGSGAGLDQDFRLRTGEIQIDWKDRGILAGVESPIFAPRQPDSLAQVAYAPLSGAGNLWLWIPQVRFEQQFHFSENSGLRAQVGVVQTSESGSYQGEPAGVEPARPGIEGRFELFHGSPDGPRIEFAPGFHTSSTHVLGHSVASRVFSLDWLARPWRKLEFTGAFFRGQDVAPLGGLQQGLTIFEWLYHPTPVHAQGGWGQLTIPATSRLSFHIFSGVEDDRNIDLGAGAIARNWLYGANLFYRLAPNVLLGIESSQARTAYIGGRTRLNNHYDLALAYLF